ncbi:tRNA (adenosine(37)-N6)-threonylcarbamoyltransferase complex transferase subunit TsaD [Patescibacteria group bacterium]|nr:tRNA (adenosine(37)-N6)-threonylcarbamoyltransferase complex transferase subunit TsaD [Patescibacteria group bacterium]
MIILGIETSCDDTGIAVVEASKRGDFNILSNIVSSQIKIHEKYGGVVPNLAAREHVKNIEPCLKESLKQANKTIKDIDAIAVTIGPGLIPSLLIGVHFAKALAYKYKKPIIPINHIEAHILAVKAENNIKLPAIALIVSGGHTQLILIDKKYKIIGETRDDAAGECFDKIAKLLNLGYPGGPEISKQAEKCKTTKLELPRPMIHQKNYDFSFSGLKTAVLHKVKENKYKTEEIAKESQQAIIDVLIKKTIKAKEQYKAKTVILAGGVAANKELRKQFQEKTNVLIPDFKLCTDNGAMIAIAAFSKKPKNLHKIKADANLRIK